MAKNLKSMKFDALVQRLERMADGIVRHKGEENFPKVLDDAQRRGLRQDLENLRQQYEELTTKAEQAYDLFGDKLKSAEVQLAKDDEIVRGLYGKTNPVVADFGTKVIATTRKKKTTVTAKVG